MQKSHDREPKDVDLKTMIEDIYIDGSGGAEKAIDRTLPDVRQHRDLQHIKKNIGAWKGKFNNEAWRPWLKDAIEFLAKLPCKQEFEAVSHNLISMFNRTDLCERAEAGTIPDRRSFSETRKWELCLHMEIWAGLSGSRLSHICQQ